MNEIVFSEKMEIKDNTFARQFETFIDGNMVSVEYSFQEKKIFFHSGLFISFLLLVNYRFIKNYLPLYRL